MSTRVIFPTTDGVTIVGHLYDGPADGPAALLLHMMSAAKESWRGLAEALIVAGFSSVLAIDLRGHGESVESESGRLDYKTFTDAEHQAKIRDVEAAAAWLEKERSADKRHLVVVGASIGANLAIVYAAAHPDIPAVVALSPGLDYHGVTTIDKVAAFASDQALLLVASAGDEYSFDTDQTLSRQYPDAKLIELDGADMDDHVGKTANCRSGRLLVECSCEMIGWAFGWALVRS